MKLRLILASIVSLSSFALEIKVGLFNLSPYVYVEEGKLKGALVRFLNEIEEQNEDIKFNYKVLPYKRLLSDLKSSQVDLAIFYPNIKAGTDIYKGFKTLGNINYVLGKDGLRNLSTMKIGVIRAASYGKEVDSISDTKKVFLKDYYQGISLFKRERLNHLVIPSTVLEHYCKTNDCTGPVFKYRESINEKNNWFHFSKNFLKKDRETIKKAHDLVLKSKGYLYLHDLL